MADLRTAAQQALEALEFFRGTAICDADTKVADEGITALRAALAKPVQFDPAEAMRLADDYASAQSELDGEHSTSRKYYVEGRDEARAALAAYLGIKEAK